MKKTLQTIALCFAIVTGARAQAPLQFNYQGVARNTSGIPLASAPIGIQIIIHDGSATGTVVYQETHTQTTNSFGLYTVAIGTGTVVTGSFTGIAWASGSKFMEVDLDPTGGTSYTAAGTTQLLSVPYAVYANTAGTATDEITSTGTTNHLPKFTSPTALGNSLVYDEDTVVGVNTTTPTPMSILNVSGAGTAGGLPYYQAGIVADGATTLSASGVYGQAGWRGVFGHNVGNTGGLAAIGVQGTLETGSTYTIGYGVYGSATGTGPTNYGVYGAASGATSTNYAGYFSGALYATSASSSIKSFKIDDPRDPANKYLYHSSVESNEMMDLYKGNVTTDADGNATVTLPSYFTVLNKDYDYQLTCIGQFAQAIVSEEISSNQFRIKTDKPNVKVSWQVSGVRQDPAANTYRIQDEVEKPAAEKGTYLMPELYGYGPEKAPGYMNGANGNTPKTAK